MVAYCSAIANQARFEPIFPSSSIRSCRLPLALASSSDKYQYSRILSLVSNNVRLATVTPMIAVKVATVLPRIGVLCRPVEKNVFFDGPVISSEKKGTESTYSISICETQDDSEKAMSLRSRDAHLWGRMANSPGHAFLERGSHLFHAIIGGRTCRSARVHSRPLSHGGTVPLRSHMNGRRQILSATAA